MGDARHGRGGGAGAPGNLLVGHALIHEPRDLEALAHRVELVRGTQVAQKRHHGLGAAQTREGVDEFVEAVHRRFVRGGRKYFSTGHVIMLTCYNADMQLIPAIDLLGDDVVRLERGDYDRVLFRQPIEEFVRRVVATNPSLIHVVDLQGARDGAVRLDAVRRCVAAGAGTSLQISGGIRSLESAAAVLAAGATRIIVGTSLWQEDEGLAAYVAALGERLVAALDIRDGRLAVRGWLADAPISLNDALQRCREVGVARLHVTAIERDGTMAGPDFALYEEVCASGIPVVAAGGVRDEDLDTLNEIGCEAAVMGMGYLTRLGLSDLL